MKTKSRTMRPGTLMHILVQFMNCNNHLQHNYASDLSIWNLAYKHSCTNYFIVEIRRKKQNEAM